MNWKKLQNGSDIRGVALEGVEGENVNLSPAVCEILGKSFASWLGKKYGENLRVAVGTDSRLSGPELERAFISGLESMGVKIYQCGLSSTPAMFMTTQHEEIKAHGGVMLTASHLPFNRNGLKFFTAEGGLNKADITEILEMAERNVFPASSTQAVVIPLAFIDMYSAHLTEYIRKETGNSRPLAGLKIIVDAGNGAGGFFAGKVLQPLGADTEGSQFLEPDGNFPNHIPNPENEEAMASISNAVVKARADLGIIFDTDVDRAAIVTSDGEAVNRNDLIAMISVVVLREHPGSVIVTDSITSEGLSTFIEKDLGGIHHRFRRGYKNVINESVRLNKEGRESWLAIETSGHAAMKENYFLDDGAFLVAKLLVEMAKLKKEGKYLKDHVKNLQRPAESREFRVSVKHPDFKEYGGMILKELSARVEQVEGWEIVTPNYEGLRVRCLKEDQKGWFLIRLSLHDPVMPVNIESDIQGGVDNIKTAFSELLTDYAELDYSSLNS